MLYPGGGRREYDYDPLMRITRILAKDPGKNIVLDYSYSYDSMDNILSKQTERGTYNYTYDALYRLTDVQVDIPGQGNEGFSYDGVGNRLSEEGVEGEWTYNGNNELLTFATTEYTYDANGNATQLLLDGTVMFTYHYNAQDRLVQVDDINGSTVAEYAYDPFGRRLWKEVDGTKTYFFYADEGLVAEYDASGVEIRSYGYRPDSTWTTDPLWLKHGDEYYFYQNDHLGTPQRLVQQNGAIAWSAGYTAFGKATIEVETVVNNLRFPGQYFDAETGLHYNFQRNYELKIGRYLGIDPIGLAGGINVYTYVLNNPMNWIDPTGEKIEGSARMQVCTRRFHLEGVIKPQLLGKIMGPPLALIFPPRHCYVVLSTEETLSFDNNPATRDDPLPDSTFKRCYPIYQEDIYDFCLSYNREYCTDTCMIQAMDQCYCKPYKFIEWNCCDCVRSALRACRCKIPPKILSINWGY